MSSNPVTSFRKRLADAIDIPGARVSVQNAQLLTSSGSSTLDFFLGGGLAVGTICLIEEDHYASYSDLILKYFFAEGISWNHSVFLASGEKDPAAFLRKLPATKVFETPGVKKSSDGLNIAWRYKDKKEAPKADFPCVGFDLSKTMPEEALRSCATWDPCSVSFTVDNHILLVQPYTDLYLRIKEEISVRNLKTTNKKPDGILRIGIKSVASPLWSCSQDNFQCLSLIQFLYSLKALLRSSFSVAVVTLPSFLSCDAVLLSKMHQICDYVFHLESFLGSQKKSNPLFKDFDGLLHIKKLPVLNTFVCQNVITSDLAFKLRKKGLLIECIHLPPDLEESSEEFLSCGSGHGKKLEF